jgi:carbon-monoxide dehydrogenase medium subunit
MEIADFIYHRPADIHAAWTLLAELGSDAHVLAGGTEVLVDLKQHTFGTRHLVSLRDLAELREIRVDDRGLYIGSMATHETIVRSDVVRRTFPALSDAAATLAAVQVRNRGTIGGNFCSAVPSADLPPICIAAGAEVILAGPDGERAVAAETFFEGPRQTVRKHEELLLGILIPRSAWHPGTGAVVLGAVHPVPLLAETASSSTVGHSLSPELSRAVGEIAAGECSPISDVRGSAEYRRELVRVLTVRALEHAYRVGCGHE